MTLALTPEEREEVRRDAYCHLITCTPLNEVVSILCEKYATNEAQIWHAMLEESGCAGNNTVHNGEKGETHD